MKTNHNGHVLRNLTNRVMAVIDDERNTQAAVEANMPRPRPRSVRRQLLVLLLSAVSGAWVVAASVSFRDARHGVSEVLDAHLAQTASLITVQRDGDEDHDEVDSGRWGTASDWAGRPSWAWERRCSISAPQGQRPLRVRR
jgi:hypothetical protein